MTRPGTFARRLAAAALLVLAAIALAPAARAADSVPWQQQTEEFLIDATARHDGATDSTLVNVSFGWGHFVTDRTQIGAVVNGIFGDTEGVGVGPLYRFNFLPIGCDAAGSCKGNLLLTGSASALTGDLVDQAAAVAATGFGVRWFAGRSSAVNFILNATRAIEPGEDGGNGENVFDSYSFTIGISFGVPQAPAS